MMALNKIIVATLKINKFYDNFGIFMCPAWADQN